MRRVIIIGSGLAGMSAAYYLLKNGNGRFDVEILEKDDRVGGRVSTLYLDGTYIDLGGFMIFPFYKALRGLIEEVGLSDSMKRFASDTEWYQLKRGGSLVNGRDISISDLVPFSIFKHILLPVIEGRVNFYEPDLSLFDRETAHEYYKEHLPDSYKRSENLDNEVFEAYTYTSISHIPMTLCMSVAKELALHGMFSKCEHIEGGTSLIVGKIKKEIENLGGKIRLESSVKNIKANRVCLANGDDVKADEVIFASLPPREFLNEHFNNAKKVSNTHFYTVVAEMESDTNIQGEPWFVLYCSMPQNRRSPHISSIGQCSSFSNLSNRFLIMYVSIHKNDTKNYTVEELKEICESELRQYFPDNRITRIFASLDWKHTMPIIDIDLMEEFRLKQGLNGCYYAGDYTGIPCMDIAVYSGKSASEKIIAKYADL